jgi:F0F1-type ATP synthase membrane subunit c/vacuolar-type H+-ATPase subunit K
VKRTALLGLVTGLIVGVVGKLPSVTSVIASPSNPIPTIVALVIGACFAIAFARRPNAHSAFAGPMFIGVGIILFI